MTNSSFTKGSRKKEQHIACIGECMIEFSSAENNLFRQSFAGDTLNTAVYLARSLRGSGHRIGYATALGQDSMSDAMVHLWQQEGIDCSMVARVADKLPGLYTIQLDRAGERSFSYWRSDSAARSMFAEYGLSKQQLLALSGVDCLYLSAISVAILDEAGRETLFELLYSARQNGAIVVFDSNYRPALWPSAESASKWYQRAVELTDLALVTFDDEQALFGDAQPEVTLERLHSVGEVVVKNGAAGAFVQTAGQVDWEAAVAINRVVDTTSAGDSFNGAYLAARICGTDPVAALRAGHAMASLVIQYQGALIPQSVTDQLTDEQ